MTRLRLILAFQFLILLIPLNVYMWGEWLLVNIQWALFRYQQSPYGNSLILGHKDIMYIYLGQTTGLYNIAAALFWTAGALVLLAGLCYTLIAINRHDSGTIRMASYCTISGGIFFCCSAISRFLGGFAIPVGVPVIFILGWWMYKDKTGTGETGKELDDEEVSVPE